MTTFVADQPTASPAPPRASLVARPMLRTGPVAVKPPVGTNPKPKPKRSRRSFYALLATRDEIRLPRYQALGYLEQSRLIQRAQAGDIAAKQTVWLRNARLAYSVANRYRSRRDLMADRVQEAQLGIGRSIDLFKVDLLFAFSTYAFTSMRRRLLRHCGDVSFSTRLPSNLQEQYFKFRKRVVLAPTRAAWFDARDKYLDESPGLYAHLIRVQAIAEPGPIADAHETEARHTDPGSCIDVAETRAAVLRAVDQLPPRLRQVIVERYGLWGQAERTLMQIGDDLGLTRERIRQMEAKAERMLREALYDAVRSGAVANEWWVPAAPPADSQTPPSQNPDSLPPEDPDPTCHPPSPNPDSTT